MRHWGDELGADSYGCESRYAVWTTSIVLQEESLTASLTFEDDSYCRRCFTGRGADSDRSKPGRFLTIVRHNLSSRARIPLQLQR